MPRVLLRSLLASAMLALMLSPAVSHAALGINLSWDDCYTGGGAVDKVDACTADFGVNRMIVAIDPGGVIDNVNGAQGIIDIQVDDTAIPDYWRLDTGGCRQGKLAADPGIGVFNCPEAWSQVGNAAGGANFALSPEGHGANWGRITWICAVPGVVTFDAATLNDWYVIAINLNKSGSTTCAGCSTPACIVANEVRLTKPPMTPGGDVFIYNAAVGQHVTWQGGGTLACPASTPAENRTWGQVKHLYR